MRPAISILITLLLTLNSNAQEKIDTSYKNRSFVYASFGYSQTVLGKVLPSNGTQFGLGLNVARIFKQNFVLGLFFEARGAKALGSNKKYGYLTNDINANLISTYDNPHDSTRARFLSDAFNEGDFFGSYMLNYGLIFSPFPDKYGGLMLEIKRGFYDFMIYGAYGNPYLEDDNSSDYTGLSVPVNFNVQLTCKPLTFFKPKRENVPMVSFRNNILISAFFEQTSFRKSELAGTSLTKFLAPDFFEKYKRSYHFGFKVAVGIY